MNPSTSNPTASLLSRRQMIMRSGQGFGGLALAHLLGETAHADAKSSGTPGLPGLPHFAAKAKRVIFLFMSGGISQLESFDPKPLLNKRQGEPIPSSVLGGKAPLGMSSLQSSFPLVGSAFKFAQHGKSGAWMSELFPQLGKLPYDICCL